MEPDLVQAAAIAERKAEEWRRAAAEITAVIEGEPQPVARMASIACLLAQRFPHFFWTGFYCRDPERPDELVIGPYQGTMGCLRIPFGRGVCGTAAAERRTLIIPDVHAFDGHIACDSRSNSEIVVPVIGAQGCLLGVLDIDATAYGVFDATDAEWLERILSDAFGEYRRLLG
ncbi:MAG: GAF domain-containing protein [Alphaproteobacteria bacterium]|nr:MAG: GAF domain-containing protein [Alphaproteobacteria bacterium]